MKVRYWLLLAILVGVTFCGRNPFPDQPLYPVRQDPTPTPTPTATPTPTPTSSPSPTPIPTPTPTPVPTPTPTPVPTPTPTPVPTPTPTPVPTPSPTPIPTPIPTPTPTPTPTPPPGFTLNFPEVLTFHEELEYSHGIQAKVPSGGKAWVTGENLPDGAAISSLTNELNWTPPKGSSVDPTNPAQGYRDYLAQIVLQSSAQPGELKKPVTLRVRKPQDDEEDE